MFHVEQFPSLVHQRRMTGVAGSTNTLNLRWRASGRRTQSVEIMPAETNKSNKESLSSAIHLRARSDWGAGGSQGV
jgi:hypothetical protein